MKKKGLLVVLFLGGIMVTSGFGLQSMMGPPPDDSTQFTITGTPADNFPDIQRAQFCGVGEAKKTYFVTEYKIPTICAQPLAITTDPQGNVWFTETNTGGIAKFDITTETFTEYVNTSWPDKSRSMMWGLSYLPDDSFWFTDETFSSIWKFSISDESYKSLRYPVGDQPLPQKIKSVDSNLVVSDYSSGHISFFSPTSHSASFFNIPPILNGSLIRDFTIDTQNNLWYPTWNLNNSKTLVKINSGVYDLLNENTNGTINDFVEFFGLPRNMITPTGITLTNNDAVWITDSDTSFFYMINTTSSKFVKYVTSDPSISSYGNVTGAVKNPISKPFWIDSTSDGKIIFNEQLGNRIAIFDPDDKSLIEYEIPSRNPNWADCGDLDNCGISQISDFTIYEDKIWFTEWVENNIGFVDTSKELPFDVDVDKEGWDLLNSWSIQKGKQDILILNVTSSISGSVDIVTKSSADSKVLQITPEITHLDISPNMFYEIPVLIKVPEDAVSGKYNILLGVKNDDVVVSKNFVISVAEFVTILDDSAFKDDSEN